VLGVGLNHYERYEEALEQLAIADRLAPKSFQQVLSLGHRCWALYGLGRIEEALEVVKTYVRIDPNGRFQLMTHCVFLQALGRTQEVPDAIRKARLAAQGEGLDFWVGLARGSYMSEKMFETYSQHFTDAWNATPADAET
jgi:tetratricopeptide (TPR) repeat protein